MAGKKGEEGNLIQQLLGGANKSPLMKQIIEGVLASLVPGEQAARTAQTDAFRSAGAGALRSGAYGRAVPQLEGELAGKRGIATSGAMMAALGPLLQALMTGRGQDISAATAAAAQRGSSKTGWENIPPSQGLNTPMTGGKPAVATAPATPARQTLNLDELLKQLLGGRGGVTPTYPGAGGISASYPGAGSYNPWAELQATNYGYLNPGQQPEQPAFNPWAGWTDQDWSNFEGA